MFDPSIVSINKIPSLLLVCVADEAGLCLTRPQGYKTFFMLNSTEHAIYPAHKYSNANCWHVNIFEQDK